MNAVNVMIFMSVGIVIAVIAVTIGLRLKSSPRWGGTPTLKEKAVMYVLAAFFLAIIGLIGVGFGTGMKSMDVEIWNGQVTSKDQERVSCSHSYDCNCRQVQTCTGTGKDRTCSTSTQCDTCYEHNHDYRWNIRSNVGDVEIERIDRQGKNTPPRWSQAVVGEPFAVSKTFTNYIKATPESLFNKADLALAGKYQIPGYPGVVYDYYRINRVLSVGVNVPDIANWNADVSNILRNLGPLKKANIVVVFTNNPAQNYANALNASWLGGKKNDVIVVIGTPEYPKIEWVSVLSWSDNQLFKVTLRDAIYDVSEVKRPEIIAIINENVQKSFVKKSFKDFDYLQNDIQLDDVVIYVIIFLQILFGAGIAFFIKQR